MKKLDIAYCILCHKKNEVLDTLIKTLSKDFHIYLHVDKKANIEEFKEYESLVCFVEDRTDVRWGSHSIAEAMVSSLKETKKREYDYIGILSGDDLPIKSNEEIINFFGEHYGEEFIGYTKDISETNDRLKYVYNSFWYDRRDIFKVRIFRGLQRRFKFLMKKNELYDRLPKLYKGTNWFTITKGCRDYILDYLDKNSWYNDAFKNSFCADEIFFHTIVCNSDFKEKIFMKYGDDDNRNSLKYIDWVTGPEYPRNIREEDYDKIKNTDDVLFARKFTDDTDIQKYKKTFNM